MLLSPGHVPGAHLGAAKGIGDDRKGGSWTRLLPHDMWSCLNSRKTVVNMESQELEEGVSSDREIGQALWTRNLNWDVTAVQLIQSKQAV